MAAVELPLQLIETYMWKDILKPAKNGVDFSDLYRIFHFSVIHLHEGLIYDVHDRNDAIQQYISYRYIHAPILRTSNRDLDPHQMSKSRHIRHIRHFCSGTLDCPQKRYDVEHDAHDENDARCCTTVCIFCPSRHLPAKMV